jgi:hypothetical protein
VLPGIIFTQKENLPQKGNAYVDFMSNRGEAAREAYGEKVILGVVCSGSSRRYGPSLSLPKI